METIAKELTDFLSSVGPKIGDMQTKANTVKTGIETVTSANSSAKGEIDTYYNSYNKSKVLSYFDSINEIYNGVLDAITGKLIPALSACNDLKTKIEQLNTKNEEIKAQEDIINDSNASDDDKEDAKTEKASLEEEFKKLHEEAKSDLAKLKSDYDENVDSLIELSTSALESSFGVASLDFGTLQGGSYSLYTDPTTGLQYYMYVPEYDTSVEGLPVTIYLGGSGEIGSRTNAIGLSKMLQDGTIKPKGIVIVPVIPSLNSFVNNKDGFQEKLITSVNNIVQTYKCDENRISISGHSMGAEACYILMNKNPGYFSACVPISGSWEIDYSNVKGTKVRAIHSPSDTGNQNRQVNYEYADERVRKMQQLGIDAQLCSVRGGHNIQNKAYTENIITDENGNPISTIDWLQSQTRA